MSHGISRPSLSSPFALLVYTNWILDCWQLLYLSQTVAAKANGAYRNGTHWRATSSGGRRRWCRRAGRPKRRRSRGRWLVLCSVCASQPSVDSGGNGWEWNRRKTGVLKTRFAPNTVNCVGLMDKPVKDTIELLPSLPRPTLPPCFFHSPYPLTLFLLYEIPGQIRSSLI